MRVLDVSDCGNRVQTIVSQILYGQIKTFLKWRRISESSHGILHILEGTVFMFSEFSMKAGSQGCATQLSGPHWLSLKTSILKKAMGVWGLQHNLQKTYIIYFVTLSHVPIICSLLYKPLRQRPIKRTWKGRKPHYQMGLPKGILSF